MVLPRRIVLVLSALSVVCFLALAGTGCGSTTPGGPVSSACPPGQKCQTRLTLLHTADIHSRLFPYDLLITQIDSELGLGTLGDLHNVGGVARLLYILKRERARSDRVLHLDSGDCFQGAPIFNFYSGEPEVRAQSLMGTDAAVVGNHEFDSGAANVTRQFQKWSNFPLLAANYQFDDPKTPGSPALSTVTRPFTVLNREGLKIAVIGMANLSSLTSIFDQPNRLGVNPLNTVETTQFYVDLLRPYVDVVVVLSHLGLQVDEDMVRGTTGIDVVLGGHNHIVINPPQQQQDCSADPTNPGFVWVLDPSLPFDNSKAPPNDAQHPDPVNHPYKMKRACKPRNVLITHSGAFAKYLGRLDLVLSNDPADVPDYDPINGFEVISSKYTAFPIDDQVPQDAQMVEMLQPYQRTLDLVGDLDIIAGFSPSGAKRTAPQGGDSPMGNLVATAAWLRLGIQTDFSLTNTTGIRTDLNPGPVTIEEMYNIFPFNNSITKMQLSGLEVQDMFDFVARRSGQRGCASQAQIAGARVRLNCNGCSRGGTFCNTDADCLPTENGCDTNAHACRLTQCAEQVYIGHTETQQGCSSDDQCPALAGKPIRGACDTKSGRCYRVCGSDADCPGNDGRPLPGGCDKSTSTCQSLIQPENLYELATSNYLAGGGSGFRTLQRNTTQFDTKIQQRDALIDYIRQGKPCGYKTDDTGKPVFPTAEGLKPCATDGDCASEGDFVCACPSSAARPTVDEVKLGGVTSCVTNKDNACDPAVGRCVRRDCRDGVAAFHERRCAGSPDVPGCQSDLAACNSAGEECKLLACVDDRAGAITDNRVEMIGK